MTESALIFNLHFSHAWALHKILRAAIFPLIFEIVFSSISALVKNFGDNGAIILPDIRIIISCGLFSCLLICAMYFSNKSGGKTFFHILVIILYAGIGYIFIYFIISILIILSIPFPDRIDIIREVALSVFIFLTIIVPIIYSRIITTKNIPNKMQKNEYAVTGTCISFLFRKDINSIETYMIKKEYKDKGVEWMFPGGHALHIDHKADDSSETILFSPEIIAIKKTEEEAAIKTNIIDKSLQTHQLENRIKRFEIRKSPHYTYLFHQHEHIPCYKEQGHHHHYDEVFIGEVEKKLDVNPTYDVAEIILKTQNMDRAEIASAINAGIRKAYEKKNLECNESCSDDSYQVYMLLNAHIDYIDYKKGRGELQ